MSDLEELIERVEKAGGPDASIDADIYLALYPEMEGINSGFQGMSLATAAERFREKDPEYWPVVTHTFDMEPLTSSLDAIVGLIERELPGWQWSVTAGVGVAAELSSNDGTFLAYGDIEVHATAQSAPMALCLCFLRARAKLPQRTT